MTPKSLLRTSLTSLSTLTKLPTRRNSVVNFRMSSVEFLMRWLRMRSVSLTITVILSALLMLAKIGWTGVSIKIVFTLPNAEITERRDY